MKKMWKKSCLLALILAFALVVSACGQKPSAEKSDTNTGHEQKTENLENQEGDKSDTNESNESKKEVEISNMDEISVFSKVPEKIFCNEINLTEILLELGLGDKIVAIAGGEFNPEDALPKNVDVMQSLKYAGDYLSLEAVIATGCDFVYSNPTSYSENYTLADFNEQNVDVYACRANYVPGATVDDVFIDIENLGKIFHVEDKAQELIESLKAKQEALTSKIGGEEDLIEVFVYDSGEANVLTPGRGLVSDIIRKAGGRNVFEDVEKPWSMVSWEEIVARNPQVILVNIYPRKDISFEEKVAQLKENPILKDLDAVKNDRFIELPMIETFAGVQIFNGMERIQEGLKSFAY